MGELIFPVIRIKQDDFMLSNIDSSESTKCCWLKHLSHGEGGGNVNDDDSKHDCC